MILGNESAFPNEETQYVNGIGRHPTGIKMAGGLTKRELFAAMAMQSLIAKLPLVDHEGMYGLALSAEACDKFKADVAESARGYADALLAELAKSQGGTP